MSNHGDEITRFSASGKTFFFNRVEARNGREFLGINTIWGSGNQERVVLFPEQILPFYRAVKESLKEMMGVVPAEEQDESPLYEAPSDECPKCGTSKSNWFIRGDTTSAVVKDWTIQCNKCGRVIMQGGQDVGQ